MFDLFKLFEVIEKLLFFGWCLRDLRVFFIFCYFCFRFLNFCLAFVIIELVVLGCFIVRDTIGSGFLILVFVLNGFLRIFFKIVLFMLICRISFLLSFFEGLVFFLFFFSAVFFVLFLFVWIFVVGSLFFLLLSNDADFDNIFRFLLSLVLLFFKCFDICFEIVLIIRFSFFGVIFGFSDFTDLLEEEN